MLEWGRLLIPWYNYNALKLWKWFCRGGEGSKFLLVKNFKQPKWHCSTYILYTIYRVDIGGHIFEICVIWWTQNQTTLSQNIFFPEVLTWRVSGWERGGVPRVRETESDSPSSPRSSRPLTSASSREGPTLYISATYLGLRHMSFYVPLVLLHLLISSPPQLIAASDAWPVHRPSVKTARRKTRENAQENLRRTVDVLRAGEKKGEGISQLITVTALNHYYLFEPVSLSTYVDLIMSVLKTPNLKFTWRWIPKSFWYHPE